MIVSENSTVSDTEQAYAAEGTSLEPSRYFALKYVIGRTVAAILLVPGLPLMAVLLLVVRTTSRGPALFRQTRVGLRGRTFSMLKIRTMIVDAEKKTGPIWSTGVDPRVTPLGRVLRKLHLDELPQLFNVLAGDMALLGPRPERPEIALRLAESVPGYWRRLAVLPGISGLAQINLPPDTDLESVRRKQVLDLEYIRQASLMLDIRMFCCSLFRLLGISGDLAMNLLMLKREPIVPEAWRRVDPAIAASATPPTTIEQASALSRPLHAPPAPEAPKNLDGLSTEPWPALRATP